MVKKILIFFIKLYKVTFSGILGGQCRFVPSCSEYARESIERFGTIKGVWLTAWRLLRCHPFSRGGYDTVPDKRSEI